MTRWGARVTRLAACDDCLRRTDLIAAFAPWLDVEWRRAGARAGARARRRRADRARPERRGPRTGYAAFSPRGGARADRGRAGSRAVCRCDAALPGARCASWPTRPRSLHVAGRLAALARGAPRRDRRRAPRHRATGSRSPARWAAGSPRRASRSSPASRSASTRPRTSARSTRPRAATDRGGAVAAVAVLAGGADVPYPRVAPRPLRAGRRARLRRLRAAARLHGLPLVLRRPQPADRRARRADGRRRGRRALRLADDRRLRRPARPAGRRRARPGHVALLGRHERAARRGRRPGPRHPRRARPAPRPVGASRGRRGRRRRPDRAAPARACSTRSSAATAASPSSRPTPPSAGQILEDLTDLELRGLVRREFGGRYVRALDARP